MDIFMLIKVNDFNKKKEIFNPKEFKISQLTSVEACQRQWWRWSAVASLKIAGRISISSCNNILVSFQSFSINLNEFLALKTLEITSSHGKSFVRNIKNDIWYICTHFLHSITSSVGISTSTSIYSNMKILFVNSIDYSASWKEGRLLYVIHVAFYWHP